MYPNQFDYYRADSVSAALDLLEDHADEETELLAGGHSLLPTMKTGLASPDVLIDIGHIDALRGIETGGDSIAFGALVNYAEIAGSDDAHEHAPALAEAAGEVGDIQVRNAGTIGGNLAHSDPASDLPAAALASNATLRAEGPDGEREIDVDDFFQGMFATALEEREILTGVEVPNVGSGVGAYVKKPSPSSGYAMVGVAVRLRLEGGTIESARVAANGAFDHGTRLDAVEDALVDEGPDADVAEAAAAHATDGAEDWEFMEDLQASGEFRAQLLTVYTRRALERAFERAATAATA